ncbi:ABC transporter ATP-binding protein [Candidatus Micrarchaeota archaeon]|nr:ABC transporter ATP-binding protein [Candidatus Micrarchaeota archaeon]
MPVHDVVLCLESVSKRYLLGKTVVDALRGVDFSVRKGEFVAIMGPSGSGKSTLLGILGLLDKPTGGKVFIDGSDATSLGDDKVSLLRARTIGFVFQFFFLVPSLTALENVVLPLMFLNVERGERERLASNALERVGLSGRMHHRPSELSGGERQRCAIARALVTNPSFILADEPTGNLDSKTGKEIMNLFKELNAEGKTIVAVTHDEAIASYAERVIHLRDGLVEEGGKGKHASKLVMKRTLKK